MPIFIRASQAAHLQAKDQADVVQADLGEQVLKPEASHGGLPTAPLVFIDDLHAVRGPAQQFGAIHQGVLPIRGFTILQDLLRSRLSDVDDGLSL
jgi:hypothetical protein